MNKYEKLGRLLIDLKHAKQFVEIIIEEEKMAISWYDSHDAIRRSDIENMPEACAFLELFNKEND